MKPLVGAHSRKAVNKPPGTRVLVSCSYDSPLKARCIKSARESKIAVIMCRLGKVLSLAPVG